MKKVRQVIRNTLEFLGGILEFSLPNQHSSHTMLPDGAPPNLLGFQLLCQIISFRDKFFVLPGLLTHTFSHRFPPPPPP